MRSTFDIPDGLFKKAKLMAVREEDELFQMFGEQAPLPPPVPAE